MLTPSEIVSVLRFEKALGENMSETKPSNRVRVVYDGDSLSGRVELLVMDEDGVEHVHDIPCESAMLYVGARGSRIILGIEGQYATAHIEGDVDNMQMDRMLSLCRTPPHPTAQAFATAGHCKTCGAVVSIDERLVGTCATCEGSVDQSCPRPKTFLDDGPESVTMVDRPAPKPRSKKK